MKVKGMIFIFLSFCVFLLTGCSKSIQLHQKLVVQGIGIDLQNSEYQITVQALDFKDPSSEKEPSVKLLKLSGTTLTEALESVSKQTGLIPMYSQNSVIVVGRSAAESGINNFIDFFIRHYEARPNVKICVSQTTAYDILSAKAQNGPIQARDINDLIPNNINSDVLHFVGRLQSKTSDPYCAVLGADGTDGKTLLTIKGLAVFSGDKLIDILDDLTYVGAMVVLGAGDIGSYSVDVESIGKVSLDIKKAKSKIEVNIRENEKIFILNTDISADVIEVVPKMGVRIDDEKQKEIEEKLASEIEAICIQVIRRTVDLGSDMFRFGKVLMNSNAEYFREVSQNWVEIMQTFDYSVKAKAKIDVTGTEI